MIISVITDTLMVTTMIIFVVMTLAALWRAL